MSHRDDVLFCEGDLSATLDGHLAKAVEKVNSIPEAQFLNSTDDELVGHVVSDFEVQPITLHEDAMEMDQQETRVDVSGRFDYFTLPGERTEVPGLKVTVSVPFTGDPLLWKLRPNKWQTVFPHGQIRKPGSDGIGYLDIEMQQPSGANPESYKQGLEHTMRSVRFYVDAQKEQIEAENNKLPQRVRDAVAKRRERLKSHSAVVQALNIPLKKRKGAPDIAQIPVQRKLVKPLPPVPNKPPEPGIATEDYEHILGVIRHEGRSFEATPATFAKHDEEELRDIILAHLNGHYQGDATGETFRGKGKTDIRIEQDNRAAFVGECKVWRGPAELTKALGQLLSYLTWRDCKAAVVLFNMQVGGFKDIQDKVPDTLASHPNALRPLDSGHAGEWRFLFRSIDDPDRQVTVHVFLFNLFVNGERKPGK